ncbi:hypothetical protein DM02DRAFT_373172 [Periconia macrospinosa]|uniref:Uncharacterized protein n=1 Tax=Periconia macrospinosa TaxID=97972 RepID=A0A2V1CZE6_9PLEO|nr:hypothetical protein DM02DRAFT_373172 [Periconia macrospinosa]
MGSLPPAPPQWQAAEDGMKNWLAAKAEEEKRKQEEEKTRQEGLRLEQRRIEQSMLRESMQGGIPPHLVPMIFAGIGGGSLANKSAQWIQQYTGQLQTAEQQQQPQAQSQISPELRRETRLIRQPQPGVYGAQPQIPQPVLPPTSVLPGQRLPAQPQHAVLSKTSHASGSMLPRARATQSSGHQPPAGPSSVQHLQQTQLGQQEQPSPSIHFCHWVPPTSQQEQSSGGNPTATPSAPPRSGRLKAATQLHRPPTSAPQSSKSPSFSHLSTSSASTPGRRGHTPARG